MEVSLNSSSFCKIRVISSKQDRLTQATPVDGKRRRGLSPKGDNPVNETKILPSTESNNVNADIFPKLMCPQRYQSRQTRSFLAFAVKNWEKAVTEDAEISTVYIVKTASSRKSVEKGFTEYVAEALNIEKKEDTARKQKLAKVPYRFSLKVFNRKSTEKVYSHVLGVFKTQVKVAHP